MMQDHQISNMMMQDDDDNDDRMILNIGAKNHTSERTIVPWTVIFYSSKKKHYEEGINLYFSLCDPKVAIWSWKRQIEISCSDSFYFC